MLRIIIWNIPSIVQSRLPYFQTFLSFLCEKTHFLCLNDCGTGSRLSVDFTWRIIFCYPGYHFFPCPVLKKVLSPVRVSECVLYWQKESHSPTRLYHFFSTSLRAQKKEDHIYQNFLDCSYRYSSRGIWLMNRRCVSLFTRPTAGRLKVRFKTMWSQTFQLGSAEDSVIPSSRRAPGGTQQQIRMRGENEHLLKPGDYPQLASNYKKSERGTKHILLFAPNILERHMTRRINIWLCALNPPQTGHTFSMRSRLSFWIWQTVQVIDLTTEAWWEISTSAIRDQRSSHCLTFRGSRTLWNVLCFFPLRSVVKYLFKKNQWKISGRIVKPWSWLNSFELVNLISS